MEKLSSSRNGEEYQLPRLIILLEQLPNFRIQWSPGQNQTPPLERTWSTLTFPLRVGYISISFIHLNFSFFWDLNHNLYFEEMASPNGRCHAKPNNHVLRVHSKSFISFRPPETSWKFKKSKNVRAAVFFGGIIKSWSQWSLFKLHHHPTPPQKNKRSQTPKFTGNMSSFLGGRSFGPFKTLQNFHHLWHTPKLNEKIPKRGLLLGGTPIESQTTGPPNHQFNHQLTPIKLWTLTKVSLWNFGRLLPAAQKILARATSFWAPPFLKNIQGGYVPSSKLTYPTKPGKGTSSSSQGDTSWWLNQPVWKTCSSNFIISPSRGEHKKMIVPCRARFPNKKETRRLQFPFQDILDGFPRRLWQLCPNGLWGHPDLTKMGHSLKMNRWNLRLPGFLEKENHLNQGPSFPQVPAVNSGCFFTPWSLTA